MSMKIGLNTDSLAHLTTTQVVDLAAELGLDYVEFATGNWSTAPHVDVDQLLGDDAARRRLQDEVADRGLQISALTCSGNPLQPGGSGRAHDQLTRKTIELAGRMGVERIVTMSGLPPAPGDQQPNWIVVSWPPETAQTLDWQWNEKVIPYWQDIADFTRQHGDMQLCFELHPQQVVYNVPTLFRLREAVGDIVGANLDPSHLMWLGADPIACVDALGEAVYHVHAKDTRIEDNAKLTTVLETTPLFTPDRDKRAWNYVTLGTGRDENFWTEFCAHLTKVGYDRGLSIEHEDPTGTPEQGVRDSVDLLRRVS